MLHMEKIGIIGGSGFYSLLENPELIDVNTEFGKPSDKIAIGTISNHEVVFLPRHNSKHNIPPQKVPYKANIAALESLNVKRIIATNAVGSLRVDYAPGEFVLFDQFINMTNNRNDTFFDKHVVAHVSMADPYCIELRELAQKTLEKLSIPYHKTASVVVINGPRFSSKAESRFFSKQGFDVINMTQYPEVALAKEKGMCYLGIGIVTDYDAGLEGNPEIKPVRSDEMLSVFGKNIEKAKEAVKELISNIHNESNCNCKNSLDGAIITK